MKKTLSCILGALGMFLLIVDGKTAISGAIDGIILCLQAVIPALLPFIILSGILCRNLLGFSIPILRPIGKLCNIPKGAETLLLLGFLGGYPVGAKNIIDAQKNGAINNQCAWRMLGFCNNAGPAFIFGMVSAMFPRIHLVWILWFVHIASALLVGAILPRLSNSICRLPKPENGHSITAIERCIQTMANICLWVILFRVIIAFCRRWFFWLLPLELQVFLTGLLELSNGIFALQTISCDGARFVVCGAVLGLGGVCVAIQTLSVTENLGTGFYFPGKILQGSFSALMAYFLQLKLFSGTNVLHLPMYIIFIPVFCILAAVTFIYKSKNNSRKTELSLV